MGEENRERVSERHKLVCVCPACGQKRYRRGSAGVKSITIAGRPTLCCGTDRALTFTPVGTS